MAGSSNPPDASPRTQDLDYLYASNANVSNFVSVKLSDNRKYHLWKAQMLCLMDSHNMRRIVNDKFDDPTASSQEIMRKYDSLLKGWIFGSISEDALGTVVDLNSAKDVWEKLKSIYDPQQDSAPVTLKASKKTKDKDTISVETEHKDSAPVALKAAKEIEEKDTISVETEDKDSALVALKAVKETENKDASSVETEDKDSAATKPEAKPKPEDKDVTSAETKTKGEDKTERNQKLNKATMEGRWRDVEDILIKDRNAATEAISSDDNTMLHIAVATGRNNFVQRLLQFIKEGEKLEGKNSEGSTALHVAAIVGNTYAAELLVKKWKKLLEIEDRKGQIPLVTAYYNMHLDTFVYLLEASYDDDKAKQHSLSSDIFSGPNVKIGVNLLVNAISARQYDLALKLVKTNCILAAKNDDVLVAIARTFPRGLNLGETFIYPSLRDICERIVRRSSLLFLVLKFFFLEAIDAISGMRSLKTMFSDCLLSGTIIALLVPAAILLWVYQLIRLLILMVYFPFFMLYFLLWKVAARLVAPIEHIEEKKKEHEKAKEILTFVCNEIDKSKLSGTHHPYYTRPILEAACQNAYEVVDEILCRSPEAIRCTNKSGHDIIQLAVIHRSENIYNLIYHIGERKNLYRTIRDSNDNNILHLAGRMAPPRKLNRRAGAALQLQRELQWREEVEKQVFPTYIMEENIFKETPEMVFTREHEKLVKEGENWMKTTAESCSITAALITTIVFAAAITVPGGSNQETGIPLFTKEIAFTIFAVSDAISLFTSATALLMFLSILTARFSEKDFLVSLPRRLLIGLCALLISTTAMMVAFSATLFLVFCDKKAWMLAPICGLACLPIAFFVALQFPLIVDLFRSTYVRIFGKQSNSSHGRFNPNNMLLYLW